MLLRARPRLPIGSSARPRVIMQGHAGDLFVSLRKSNLRKPKKLAGAGVPRRRCVVVRWLVVGHARRHAHTQTHARTKYHHTDNRSTTVALGHDDDDDDGRRRRRQPGPGNGRGSPARRRRKNWCTHRSSSSALLTLLGHDDGSQGREVAMVLLHDEELVHLCRCCCGTAGTWYL